MKKSNIFWGVFLVLAAVAVIAGQISGFATVGFWSVLATILLLALLVQSLVRLNFPVMFLSVAVLYLIYQAPLALPVISPWLLVLAALLAGIGLSLLVRPLRRQYYNHRVHHFSADSGNGTQALSAEENSDDNHPQVDVSFGASTRYLHSTALESGLFKVSFGSLEVYFDQATLAPEGADILLECSIGAITLYVPRNWPVKDRLETSLAGVENENRFARPEEDFPELRLSGSVSLGSIEIKYV